MDNIQLIADFDVLLAVDELDKKLHHSLQFHFLSTLVKLPNPSRHLPQGNNNLADKTLQRKIGECSIKPAIAAMDDCLVTAIPGSQLYIPSLAPPSQSELNQKHLTNGELVSTEEMQVDINHHLSPLEKAEIKPNPALLYHTSEEEFECLTAQVEGLIQKLRQRRKTIVRRSKKEKLEANLNQEQINAINLKCKNTPPTRSDNYDRILGYLIDRPTIQLTHKYPLENLVTALLDRDLDAISEADQPQFLDLRGRIMTICRQAKARKFDSDYMRLLEKANNNRVSLVRRVSSR